MVHVLVIDTDKNIISVASGYKGTPEETFLKVADDLEEMADASDLVFNKIFDNLVFKIITK